jgi:hypothetical protein
MLIGDLALVPGILTLTYHGNGMSLHLSQGAAPGALTTDMTSPRTLWQKDIAHPGFDRQQRDLVYRHDPRPDYRSFNNHPNQHYPREN